MSSQATAWLGTLNNPDLTTVEEYIKLWYTKAKATYVNGQLEQGKEGTVHIQFFVLFPRNVRLSALKKHCGKAHFSPVRRDNGASDYCLKEDTRLEGPWEHGIKPARKNVAGDTKSRNETILKMGVEHCVAEGLIHIKDYIKLKQNVQSYQLHTTDRQDHTDTRGLWYWGPPGTGKSRLARESTPYYLKAQNKWFDGYKGEPTIILDDMDSDCLAHHLKIWTDRYTCDGEVKGGTIPLLHTKFIVTSNYSIEELIKDPVMAAAIRRRFKVTHFNEPFAGALREEISANAQAAEQRGFE